ncbi:MAG TPA: hypothetical protein VFP92_10695 [Rhodanobacteraceae bacterium]|nr:hypothetical protein [Rhodanobacteraceae bacterium]
MAGEWLKFEKSTLDKPEVLAVAAALGWDADLAIGKFVRMWAWFDTHTVDGDARGVTPALLDAILRVTGFVTEVEKVGWLEVHEWGIRLPKFDIHCGETAKKRALGAKRNAAYRASNANSDAPSVTVASPREEKRREEEQELVTPNGVTCPQAADAPPANLPDCPAQRIVDLYHEKLPELPRCEKLTPTRRGYLRQRWREDLETLGDWAAFFADVRKSDFLMGKKAGRDGRPPFRADLEWLTKPANYAKFIEGKYHRAA